MNATNSTLEATPRKRGDYKIKDCNIEDTNYLSHVIDRARDTVDEVLPTLDTAPSEQNVALKLFEAFIGVPKGSTPFIKSILQLVSDLRSVGGKKPYSWTDKPPAFVCVTPQTQEHWPDLDANPIEFCERRPDAWGFGEGHYRFVFLCPRFWNHKVEPPAGRRREDACPRVRDNQFLDKDGERLLAWQKYLVIHELLHQYIADGGLGEKTNPPEVYGLNECMGIERTKDRSRNPNNIVFWIASKKTPSTRIEPSLTLYSG